MSDLVEKYINQCIDAGILTQKKIRDYKLKSGNLGVILKVYSLYTKVPFEYSSHDAINYKDYSLYLTDQGYHWLINEFKKYTLSFLRTTFSHVFLRLKDLNKLETCIGLNNFKGISGVNYKAGTKVKAMLVRKYGIKKQEWIFNTLVEARREVFSLTRFYPLEQFTLYILSEKKDIYYKQQVPLFLESNRRGVPVNLPHLKGKL